MVWTQERSDLCVKLYNEGLSCSVIAGRLGGITRNAVIGKLHRLGLSGTRTYAPIKRKVDARRERPRKPKPLLRGDGRPFAPKFKMDVEPLPPEPERPAKLFAFADLEESQCRYIYGDPKGSEEWGCCGAARMVGSPYCPGHHSVCTNPFQPKSRTWVPSSFTGSVPALGIMAIREAEEFTAS